jgi:hypothetical protein
MPAVSIQISPPALEALPRSPVDTPSLRQQHLVVLATYMQKLVRRDMRSMPDVAKQPAAK